MARSITPRSAWRYRLQLTDAHRACRNDAEPAERAAVQRPLAQRDAALALGRALLGSIEARTELLFGLRCPKEDTMSSEDWQMVSCREMSAEQEAPNERP